MGEPTSFIEDNYGNQTWYKNGKLHRNKGLPAVEWVNGSKEWYIDGKRHRDNGPATEWIYGTKEWYVNGKLHRDDGPAIENASGNKEWYVNGKMYRDGDLPAIEYANGTKIWVVDGKYHRDGNRPAIEHVNGDKHWYVNGKLHRDGGPAIQCRPNYKQWWINGIDITSFKEKYYEIHKLRAQKKIYFWIIQRIYRPGSESAKRLAEKSWQATVKLLVCANESYV